MAYIPVDPVPQVKKYRSPRTRTFLKGVIYYDDRRISIECAIRDLSATGARIVLPSPMTLPEKFELAVPQKQQILTARVRRCQGLDIAVTFDEKRTGMIRRTDDATLAERVDKVEAELFEMRQLLTTIKDKVLPRD